MKRVLIIIIFLCAINAQADIIYLKDGNAWKNVKLLKSEETGNTITIFTSMKKRIILRKSEVIGYQVEKFISTKESKLLLQGEFEPTENILELSAEKETTQETTVINKLNSPINAATIGLLQGGSLLGFDYEVRLNQDFGIQFGTGLFGFAAAFNYHIDKATDGGFISLGYKNIGFGYFSTLGPEYGYRWFFKENWGLNLQIGFGLFLSKNNEYKKDFPKAKNFDGILTYSLGIVF